MSFVLLALISLAFIVLLLPVVIEKYRKVFILFPAVFFFTNFSVPGMGSPERLLIVLVLAVFLARSCFAPQRGKLDMNLVVLFLLFSLAFVPSIFTSTVGKASAAKGVLSHMSMGLLVFLVCMNIVSRQQIMECLFGISVLVLMIIISAGYLMIDMGSFAALRAGPEVRTAIESSAFGHTILRNPTFLSRVLLMCFPFLFVGYLHSKGKRQRYYYMAEIVIVIFLTFATISKMGFGVLVISLLLVHRWVLSFKKSTAVILLLALIGCSLVFRAHLVERFEKTILEYETKGTLNRVALWKSGYEAVSEDMLFGSGAGREAVLDRMYEMGAFDLHALIKKGEIVPKFPHNTYVYVAMEGGVVALSCLVVLFGYFIWMMRKAATNAKRYNDRFMMDWLNCSTISIINTALMGITAVSIWMNLLWFLVGLTVAAMNMGQREMLDRRLIRIRQEM